MCNRKVRPAGKDRKVVLRYLWKEQKISDRDFMSTNLCKMYQIVRLNFTVLFSLHTYIRRKESYFVRDVAAGNLVTCCFYQTALGTNTQSCPASWFQKRNCTIIFRS